MSTESAAFADPIIDAIARIIRCLDGMDAEGLNWRPPAPETNSVYVLATHTMGTVEESVCGFLGGQPITRDRDAEFLAAGDDAAPLSARWEAVQQRLRATLASLPSEAMEREIAHPRRGPMTGRHLLITIAQHAAEHAGHAELTRDLYRASKQ